MGIFPRLGCSWRGVFGFPRLRPFLAFFLRKNRAWRVYQVELRLRSRIRYHVKKIYQTVIRSYS